MKYFYLILALVFSLNFFGQNSLFKEWTLQSMVIDGVEDINIPDGASINFTANSDLGGDLLFDGRAACNQFEGIYIITSSNTVDILLFSRTLAVCNTTAENEFENRYFNDILYSEGDVTSFQYTVTEFGINTTLTLTNTSTNNVAIYQPTYESELLGEWFLNSITFEGAQFDNYFNDEPDNTLTLNFDEVVESEEETIISFYGTSSCNGFDGSYFVNGSTFSIASFASLTGPCNGVVYQRYEEKYISIVSNWEADPGNLLQYQITGTGNDEILTITNTNGNFAKYGRVPVFETIFKTWYLSSIVNDGTAINIPAMDSPTLRLTTSSDAFSRILLDGYGDCNSFTGFYNIYENNETAFSINTFSATSEDCSESSYESLYFDILSNPSSNNLSYELINDGQTLVLTDLTGRKLYFRNQLLNQELLGVWNLHYINYQGNQFDNIYDYGTRNLVLDFTDLVVNPTDNSYYLTGVSSCNEFGISYSVTDSEINFIEGAITLIGCENSPISLFEFYYLNGIIQNNGTFPNNLNFAINGEGNEQTLILTDVNNNTAVYGREPLPENELEGNWYLYSIVKDGVEELNTFNVNFNMDFSENPASLTSLNYDGFAICKDYFGEYRVENSNNVRIYGISYTLDFCQQTGASFEDSYLSFFADSNITNDMLLNYNIIGTDEDQTLILTSENGDYLTYGRQTLSVEENVINNLSVQLIENPVRNLLKLDISDALGNGFDYEIFSIDGKNILKAKLNDKHSINVETLDSGMYFLMISSENNYKQTLKFIKE